MTLRELYHYSTKRLRAYKILLLVATYIITILACARVIHPEGGPKDLTPPKLVSAFPAHGSTLFSGKKIILTFDKEVDVRGLYSKLKISPSIKVGDSRGYTYKAQGNTIELELEQALRSNKTYTFNFNDAIVDTTEGNAAENIVLTFSTGPDIDSMHISGTVIDLLTTIPIPRAYVLLYSCNSELDEHKILKGEEPDYFITTDENGKFAIAHIAPGKYRVYANLSTTGILKYVPGEDKVGTIPYVLDLQHDSVDNIAIKIVAADYSELRIIRTIPRGSHCEIQFNKPIASYTLDSTMMSTLSKDKKSIYIYNTTTQAEETGSSKILTTRLHANDLNGNQIEQDVEIVLNSFNTNYLDSHFAVKPNPESLLSTTLEISIISNKPIQTINYDGVSLHLGDKTIFLTSDNLSLNDKRDNVLIRYDISNEIINYGENLIVILRLDTGAIVDIDGNRNSDKTYRYSIKNPKRHGSISGTLYTSNFDGNTGYVIQLVNLDGTVAEEIPSVKVQENRYKFSLVPPGKYLVRLLSFSADRFYWSPGNIFKNIPPDRVYIYPGLVDVLENWDITDINFY